MTCYWYNFVEKQERGVRSRQVDTNVVAVTFDTLSGPAGVHTGDVVVCNNEECTAVLSHLSKVSGGSHSDKKVHDIKLRLMCACTITNVDAEIIDDL